MRSPEPCRLKSPQTESRCDCWCISLSFPPPCQHSSDSKSLHRHSSPKEKKLTISSKSLTINNAKACSRRLKKGFRQQPWRRKVLQSSLNLWTNIQSPFKPPTYDALTLTGDIIPSLSHLRDAIRMSDNSHDIIQRK